MMRARSTARTGAVRAWLSRLICSPSSAVNSRTRNTMTHLLLAPHEMPHILHGFSRMVHFVRRTQWHTPTNAEDESLTYTNPTSAFHPHTPAVWVMSPTRQR